MYRVSGKFELLDRILPKLRRFGHRWVLLTVWLFCFSLQNCNPVSENSTLNSRLGVKFSYSCCVFLHQSLPLHVSYVSLGLNHNSANGLLSIILERPNLSNNLAFFLLQCIICTLFKTWMMTHDFQVSEVCNIIMSRNSLTPLECCVFHEWGLIVDPGTCVYHGLYIDFVHSQ